MLTEPEQTEILQSLVLATSPKGQGISRAEMPCCLTEHSAWQSTESSEAWSEVTFSSRKKHSVPKPWREAAKNIIHLSRWISLAASWTSISCIALRLVYCTYAYACAHLCSLCHALCTKTGFSKRSASSSTSDWTDPSARTFVRQTKSICKDKDSRAF